MDGAFRGDKIVCDDQSNRISRGALVGRMGSLSEWMLTFGEKLIVRCRILRLRAQGIVLPNSVGIGPGVDVRTLGGTIRIGAGTTLDRGVVLRAYGGNIVIGDNCSINPYAVLYGHGGLSIGDGVRIAAHVVVIPANHNIDDRTVFIYLQGETAVGIRIEDDVWIGAGARILDGVTLSRGTVVAAGAVVSRSTEAFGVYAGVPARKIRTRGELRDGR